MQVIYTGRMTAYSARRRLGNLGEDIACTYLSGKGFTVIARNYLRPWGEIDIVAIKEGVYRFVEVKTISRVTASGTDVSNMSAEDHIHPAKLMKIVRTVESYMANVKGDYDYQVDVITVELDATTRRARCKLYEQVL